MSSVTSSFSSKHEYTRHYRDIMGVILNGSGTDIENGHLAYCENMYRDYDGESPGAIESIPGFRRLYNFGGKINAIYLHKTSEGDYIIVHSNNSIYRFKMSDMDSLSNITPLLSVNSTTSTGFCYADDFYLLDGCNIIKIDKGGNVYTVGQNLDAYIPTLYVNSVEYEQRNLLTDKFKEVFNISNPKLYANKTEEIKYSITDFENLVCSVSGIDSDYSGHVEIPGATVIGGLTYTVNEIADNAFSHNKNITSVKINEGVKKIGNLAFYYCENIKTVYLPSSVTLINSAAFAGCTSLKSIYLGGGLSCFGESVFSGCLELSDVYYALDADSFLNIENTSVLASRTVQFGVTNTSFTIKLPFKSKVQSVSSLTINGKEKEFNLITANGTVVAITSSVNEIWELSGAVVEIMGVLTPFLSNFRGESKQSAEYGINGFSAASGCKLSESFDGRIFLSGNPKLPNTVFYTSRDKTGANNPLYIGVYNYFNDGIGEYPVISMLAVRDSLAVFKAGDDGCGSIFYHSISNTGDDLVPKIYPVAYIHSGLCACGDAISFLDDPVFVSKTGISALTQKSINFERSIACRSHNVNFDLLKEDLSKISLTEWCGYLVVGVNGKMYLADSRSVFKHRTGNTEYEWFIIDGVGCYKNAARVYRYSSVAKEGYSVRFPTDTVCENTVISKPYGNDIVYYSAENGQMYEVYPTEELSGGAFSKAICFFGCDDYLFFGTESGELCVFNNDKRGVAPDYIKNSPSFDSEEYQNSMGRRIHPYFYSFDNHAVRYAIKTPFDDCGIPHLTKSTKKHSLCIKLKSYVATNVTIDVGTDRSGYSEIDSLPSSEFNFSDFDFGRVCMLSEDYFTLPVSEKEKDWIEKQIAIYSNSFRAPIGIYSITYRYTLKGRIKNK